MRTIATNILTTMQLTMWQLTDIQIYKIERFILSFINWKVLKAFCWIFKSLVLVKIFLLWSLCITWLISVLRAYVKREGGASCQCALSQPDEPLFFPALAILCQQLCILHSNSMLLEVSNNDIEPSGATLASWSLPAGGSPFKLLIFEIFKKPMRHLNRISDLKISITVVLHTSENWQYMIAGC